MYDQDPEMFADAMEAAEKNLASASENFYETWETALTAAADAFKQNVELIAEEFDKSVSGIYNSLEEMQTAFDRQKEISELYFQNYKKVYEISKLNRQISKDLAKTDNVKAQRELNNLAAEINAYNKDDAKMSEYDLGYLQKKYELLQA
jgi:predicted  nucleic acid-binding Zn-ribbon protein